MNAEESKRNEQEEGKTKNQKQNEDEKERKAQAKRKEKRNQASRTSKFPQNQSHLQSPRRNAVNQTAQPEKRNESDTKLEQGIEKLKTCKS